MQTLEALADPVRRGVLELLVEADAAAGHIAAHFEVSRPAVSRHLRVLREAGLVRVDTVGRCRVYSLDREPLAELDAWLGQFRPLAGAEPAGAVTPPVVTPPVVTPPVVTPAATRLVGPAGRVDALAVELRRGRRPRADERSEDGPDTTTAAG